MADKRWFVRVGQAPPPSRWYRVEHRSEGEVRSLGLLADVTPHAATLAPFASRLVHEGEAGEVVLIDAGTGAVVARQDLGKGPRRGPSRKPADRPKRRLRGNRD